jgi:hypothetical protein
MSYQPIEADDTLENGQQGGQPLEFKSYLGSTDANVQNENAGGSRGYRAENPVAVGFWNIDYYQKYFDVDTQTVLTRCWRTMLPLEDYLNEVLENRPDLYGPFWTLTTVIFSLFVFSSLAHSLSSYLSSKPYAYDFKLLSLAVSLVYAYGLGVPVGLWAFLRWLGVEEWGLLDGVAIWGYGMAVWIPVSVLCIVPIPIVRWVLVGAACGVSGWFLLRNVYPALTLAEAKSARLLVIVIAVLHMALALTFKVLFFSYYVVKEVGTKDPIEGKPPRF